MSAHATTTGFHLSPFPPKLWYSDYTGDQIPPGACGWRREGAGDGRHHFWIPLTSSGLVSRCKEEWEIALLEISKVNNPGDSGGQHTLKVHADSPHKAIAGCSSLSHLDISLLTLQHQMNAKSMLAPSIRVCVLSIEVSTLPYIKLLCSSFNLNERNYCTSSMMSPFSACTWAMAPKSRIMLNISYICQERMGCPVSDKLWSMLRSAKLLLLHFGCLYYLGISALKFVFISHKNQEGIHALKKENNTCIYYHSSERSTLVRAEQRCSTQVALCRGG